MRIVTWNVNGLRAMQERRNASLAAVLDRLQADIVCIQETKLSKTDMLRLHDVATAPGWETFLSMCQYRSSYAGVATFCRAGVAMPLAAEDGMTGTLPPQNSVIASAGVQGICFPEPEFFQRYSKAELELIDQQGRCVITDHGAFVLLNVYGPAVTNTDSERFPYKLRLQEVLEKRVRTMLAAGRRVVLVGDLNIAPHPLDHCDWADLPAAQQAPALFLRNRPDRAWLRSLLTQHGGPLTDVLRRFHPAERYAYTVWGGRGVSRDRKRGSRVDFILAGDSTGPGQQTFLSTFTGAGISPSFFGSDHAPVWAELAVTLPGTNLVPPLSLRNLLKSPAGQPQQQGIRGFLTVRSPAAKRRRPSNAQEDTPPRAGELDCS